MVRELLQAPECTVFLGAGASWSSGVPLGDDAAAAIVRPLFHVLDLDATYEALSSTPDSPWPRFEVVLEILSQYEQSAAASLVGLFEGVGYSGSHEMMVQLRSGRPTLWLTTNFDDLLEQALTRGGEPFRAIYSREEMGIFPPGPLQEHLILKLHGGAGSVEESDLGARISQILRAFPQAAQERILERCVGQPVVFIGYAARDPDLRPLVAELAAGASNLGWVDRGRVKEEFRDLIANHPHGVYNSQGVPDALLLPTEIPPPSERSEDWYGRVDEWVRSLSIIDISHVLADLALARADAAARQALPLIHSVISPTSDIDRVKQLRRMGEASLRAPEHASATFEMVSGALRAIAADSRAEDAARRQALRALGMIGLRKEGLREGIQYLERALTIGTPTREEQVDLLMAIGITQVYHGGTTRNAAQSTLAAAKEIVDGLDDPLLRIQLTMRRSVLEMRSDKPSLAANLLRSIEADIREVGAPRERVVWGVNLAEALRLAGATDEALRQIHESLELAAMLRDTEAIGNLTCNRGLCHLAEGQFDVADEDFLAAMGAARRIPGEMLANILFNRGWLRLLQSELHGAIEFFTQAAEEFRRYGSSERSSGAEGYAAWALCCADRFEEATEMVNSFVGVDPAVAGTFAAGIKLAEFGISSGLRPIVVVLDPVFSGSPGHVIRRPV